jgi:tripartite-type tricarboxylate transporter receptor subunit TctC
VLGVARARPLVFATLDVANIRFFSLTLGAHILDFPVEAVAGFAGSTEETLALLRGDVDIVSVNFYSAFPEIEAGDLRPVLQITDSPIAGHPSLEHVPVLGGDNGFAARRAADQGGDRVEAAAMAAALTSLAGAGRLIAAPPGIKPDLRQCMEEALVNVLGSPEFVKAARAAKLPLDVARGSEAVQSLKRAVAKMDSFTDVIELAIDKLRDR